MKSFFKRLARKFAKTVFNAELPNKISSLPPKNVQHPRQSFLKRISSQFEENKILQSEIGTVIDQILKDGMAVVIIHSDVAYLKTFPIPTTISENQDEVLNAVDRMCRDIFQEGPYHVRITLSDDHTIMLTMIFKYLVVRKRQLSSDKFAFHV